MQYKLRSTYCVLRILTPYLVSVVAWTAFAAGAAACVMSITRSLRFATQGFEFVPGLEVFTVEGAGKAFLAIEKHHDFVAHRQDINDFAFAFRCDNALVAFGQLL